MALWQPELFWLQQALDYCCCYSHSKQVILEGNYDYYVDDPASQRQHRANSAKDWESFEDQNLLFPNLHMNLLLSQNYDGANSAQELCPDQDLHPIIPQGRAPESFEASLEPKLQCCGNPAIRNWRIFPEIEIWEEQLVTQVIVTQMLCFADDMEFAEHGPGPTSA